MRLRSAFAGHDVVYASVDRRSAKDLDGARFHQVFDSNKTSKLAVIQTLVQVALILFRENPDVIVSTGAAPGCLAIRLGKLLGIKTVWVDSIANAQVLSLSGRLVARQADLWLTQWPHLATEQGPFCEGCVL